MVLRTYATRAEKTPAQAIYTIDQWTRLRRFIILGSESSGFSVTANSAKELTIQNAQNLLGCIKQDGIRTVNEIVEVSHEGLAPKADPALFALAYASAVGDVETRRAAFAALPQVARTGTHLLHFTQFMEQFRGWGAMPRRAVGAWFNDMPAGKLAYQAAKYQQRDGWSMRDILRLTHPKATTPQHDAIYHWIVKQGWESVGETPHDDDALRIVWAMEYLRHAAKNGSLTPQLAARFVRDYGLTREMVPTNMLNEPLVLDALLVDMPLTAMIRNLGNLTRHGIIAPLSDGLNTVVSRLADDEYLRKSRIHPMALLVALRTYQSGRGFRGTNVWSPQAKVIDALDAAFYKAFKNVVPSGKKFLLGLDVSGSMAAEGTVAGIESMNAREVSAAMALITAATEPQTHIIGFTSGGYGYSRSSRSNGVTEIDISPSMRLDAAIQKVSNLPFGATDCSLPMKYAMEKGIAPDAFVIYTDSETNSGHAPMAILKEYRRKSVADAKLIVVATQSAYGTVGDPNDPGCLDVTGFDSSAPALISQFVAGKI